MSVNWGRSRSSSTGSLGGEEAWSFTSFSTNTRRRTRFNLLALEFGEYYFQDYAAYMYPPVPSESCREGDVVSHPAAKEPGRARHQGRIKVCSRGLVFEPAEVALPLSKFPFREVTKPFRALTDTLVCFECSAIVELRADGNVGPYVVRKRGKAHAHSAAAEASGGGGGGGAANVNGDTEAGWSVAFALMHTAADEFLAEAQQLREIAQEVRRRGYGSESVLLQPMVQERLRRSGQRFDHIHLADFREQLLLPQPVQVDRITPLLRSPGSLMVTDGRVYFQPADLNNADGDSVVSFALAALRLLCRRRHMLRQTGLELFLDDGASAYFNFNSTQERDAVHRVVMGRPGMLERLSGAMDVAAETRRWQRGEVTNYDYICFLNSVSDRSVNDLTQYPVFPWVIADYSSPTLDLANPATFRDLSKPIGALNPERLGYFKDRMASMPPLHEAVEGIPPPFLYGTHYSSPGYTLFYLVRAAPEHMLCLQNGRFDAPDRMFASIAETWSSALTNHADLKELIPEFYSGSGSFLLNNDDLPLGVTQSGQRLNDVELPPWAKNPRDFVRKLRRALESDYVSQHLHSWIDLIFGCQQRGEAAAAADNLFYHVTYEGAVDLDAISDPRERAALESQISEFGQCPRQVFVGPHPSRLDPPTAPVSLAPAFGGPLTPAADPPSQQPAAAALDSQQQQQQHAHSAASNAASGAAAGGGGDLSNSSFSAQNSDSSEVPPAPLVRQSSTSASPPTASSGGIQIGNFFRKGFAAAANLVPGGGGGGGGGEAAAGSAANSGTASAASPEQQQQARPKVAHSASVSAGSSGGRSWLGAAADGLLTRGRGSSVASNGSSAATATSTSTLAVTAAAAAGASGSGGPVTAAPGPAVVSLDEDVGFLEELARIEREAAQVAAAARGEGAATSGGAGVNEHNGDNGAAVAPGSNSVKIGLPPPSWYLCSDPRRLELRAGQPLTGVHREAVTGACIAANDTTKLCTVSKDSTLRISQLTREAGGDGPVSSAHMRRTLPADLALSCCQLTRDGAAAVAGCWDNSIVLYSVEIACVVSKVEAAHEDGVSCLWLFESLQSGADDQQHHLQQQQQQQQMQQQQVVRKLATGAWDATVKVWDVLPTGIKPASVHQLFDLETPVQSVCMDGSGSLVAAGAEDGAAVVWDLETGAVVAHVQANAAGVAVVALRWGDVGGSLCLMAASQDGTLARFTPFGASCGLLELGCGICGMDSDGATTLIASVDGALAVVAAFPSGGMQLVMRREMGLSSPARCLSVTPRALTGTNASAAATVATAVVGADDGVVRLWDIIVKP